MPTKILYVHYVPNLGGAATSLALLIKHLDRSRFIPHVLLTYPVVGDAREFFESLDVPVDHIPVNLVWDSPWYSSNNICSQAWKAFRPSSQIREYLVDIHPDIVHLNDFLPLTVGITAHQLGIPVVWHCRSVLLYKRPVLDPGQRIIEEMVHRSSRIIAISETETPQFRSEKAIVIYNPLELTKMEKARGKGPEIRRSLGIQDDEYIVLAPIPLTENKGAWDFIRACGVASHLAPDVKFRFLFVGGVPTAGRRHLLHKWTGWLGPEPYLDRAYHLAEKFGFRDQLMITGFRKDIYEVMDASDLVVFPSHLKACGRQCFEAGAMGKPIIVTMPDKNTRVVLDGQTGLILPDRRPDLLGRAIAHLGQHPEESKRMGQAGLEYVPRLFGADEHAAKVMQVYEDILKQ